jgi:hypothetical protein
METIYKVCTSCGKYFTETTATNSADYCSKECEDVFIQCAVCGEYYKLEDFFDPKNLICSKECTKKFKFKKRTDNYKFDFSNL